VRESIVQVPAWARRLVYRKEVLKTTWLFRLAVVVLVLLVALVGRSVWVPAVGRSLVCAEEQGTVDALLLDNLDANYLLFERAAALQKKAGGGVRVLVATMATETGHDAIAMGTVELMARVARLHDWEVIPIRNVEPITLHAAVEVKDFLEREKIRSVAIVTPGFRSMRSSMVYGAVLSRAGIASRCTPVVGSRDDRTWIETWHGIQEVALQFLKLQYYRFYVLPMRAGPAAAAA
jgi:hypothetical protein